MKVPDNFVPEDMHMEAYFDGGDIELCNEGFIGPENLIQFGDKPAEDTQTADPLQEVVESEVADGVEPVDAEVVTYPESAEDESEEAVEEDFCGECTVTPPSESEDKTEE